MARKPPTSAAALKKATAKAKSKQRTKQDPAKRRCTPKEEHAIQEYLVHGNKAEAYRAAYDCKPDITKGTLYVAAYEVFKRPAVQRRIDELQERAVFDHLVTKDTIARELDEAIALAKTVGSPSALVAATNAKAKLYGHMTEKGELTVKGAGSDKPLFPDGIEIRVVHMTKADMERNDREEAEYKRRMEEEKAKKEQKKLAYDEDEAVDGEFEEVSEDE